MVIKPFDSNLAVMGVFKSLRGERDGRRDGFRSGLGFRV